MRDSIIIGFYLIVGTFEKSNTICVEQTGKIDIIKHKPNDIEIQIRVSKIYSIEIERKSIFMAITRYILLNT